MGERVERAAGVALTVAAGSILVASFSPAAAASWALGLASALLPVALIALAVARRDRLRATAVVLALLSVLLAGSLAGILMLAGAEADAGVEAGPRSAGLPAAAALQLFGLALLPLLVVGLGYALTFDRRGLSADELARLRRLGRDAASREH